MQKIWLRLSDGNLWFNFNAEINGDGFISIIACFYCIIISSYGKKSIRSSKIHEYFPSNSIQMTHPNSILCSLFCIHHTVYCCSSITRDTMPKRQFTRRIIHIRGIHMCTYINHTIHRHSYAICLLTSVVCDMRVYSPSILHSPSQLTFVVHYDDNINTFFSVANVDSYQILFHRF